MDSGLIKDFIKKYNDDKKELDRKFDIICDRLEDIDSKFDSFDERINKVDKKLTAIEDVQGFIFSGFGGFSDKLDNVRVYLSTLENKINSFKTLNIQGEKCCNGELYMLKIKLHKVKPIISWENDRELSDKYREIEKGFEQLEKNI